jgi:hypothetical protein
MEQTSSKSKSVRRERGLGFEYATQDAAALGLEIVKYISIGRFYVRCPHYPDERWLTRAANLRAGYSPCADPGACGQRRIRYEMVALVDAAPTLTGLIR